jgi:multicomponent Na+:H+ antiporter subunit E
MFFLALFWLFNSGHYTPLLLSLGLVSIVFVLYISSRMDVIDNESQPLHSLSTRLPGYWCWLAKEIVVANMDVVTHIWRKRLTINPVQVQLKASQATDMGKVIYANSITLTPGTITVDLRDDILTVHALAHKQMKDLLNGDMDQRVSRLESKKC